MSIKRLGWIALVFLAAAIVSCAGEDKPYFDDSSKVNFKGAGCLAETFPNFDKFIDGELSNEGVAEFWDCVDTTLVTVERRVVGSEQNGSFKSTDLRWFVATYFLKSEDPDGIVINDILLDELMEIKRQFLGGSRQLLTRDELNATRTLVKEFKAMSLLINPYIKLLFYEEGRSANKGNVSLAVTRFTEVASRLGFLIGKQGNSYSFERLTRLLEEIDAIFEKKDKELPEWAKHIPTVQRIKSLFLNSSEDKVESGEWVSVANIFGQGLSLVFRAKYFFEEESLFKLKFIPEFSHMYSSVDRIINIALGARPDKKFPNNDFNGIIDSLDEAKLLPDLLGSDDIKHLWAVLVDKVLDKGESNADGLTVAELSEALNVFNGWYLTQRWLAGDPNIAESVIAEMKEVLQTPWEYRTDEQGRMIFNDNILDDRDNKNKTIRTPNIESSTQLNWERVAFDMILRGYIQDPEEKKTRRGLTKEELDIAFADIKPIFVQLGLIDEDDDTFATSAYFQASLFMPRSNGDFIFDFFEMIEYAHFVLAGIEMGSLFVEALPEQCILDNDIGVVDYDCWRQGFKDLYMDRYDNMAFMVDFLAEQSDREFRKVLDGLEKAARDVGSNNKTIRRSEIYKIGIFMQYIETLMFRFDIDRNLKFDLNEGLAAVPLFTPQLKELVDGLDSDKETRVIITFMMKYGNPPDITNPLSILRYLHWRWSEKKWKLNTDREKIIQILSSLTDFL